MPPFGPLLTNDGPACRVCGCTEHNACIPMEGAKIVGPACSWVETSGNDNPRDLCSACAGTAADMFEVTQRGCAILLKHRGVRAADVVVAMARAAKVRYSARLRWDAGQTISAMCAAAIGVRNMSNH